MKFNGHPAMCVLVWAAMMGFLCPTAAQKPLPFRPMAKGTIDSPNVTITTASNMNCFFLCKMRKLCSAFSVTTIPTSDRKVCRLALGPFTWTPQENSSVYMEYDRTSFPLQGFSFQRDGKLYRLLNTSGTTNITRLQQARVLCDQLGASVAVPYPALAQSIVNSLLPPETTMPLGITRMSTYTQGKWVTYDGDVFNHTDKSDPFQRWNASQPNKAPGGDPRCVVSVPPSHTWDDTPCLLTNFVPPQTAVLCRRTIGYRQSTNGKFYKLKFVQPSVVYARAEAICNMEGATLATPYPLTEFFALDGFVSMNFELTGVLGVGGTDAAVEDIWVMPDGTSFDARNRSLDTNQAWAPIAPNGTIWKNCLGIRLILEGYLVDVMCNDTVSKFICQMKGLP